MRFNIRSVGLSAKSEREISEKDIKWANLILVMQIGYKVRIKATYRHLPLPNLEVLDINDDYDFLDEELVKLLTERINGVLKIVYKL
ncbi:MAG TPA: hypothetical protein VK588_06905 [Chitinophagaceae bacterium]|nr:hypothetical protein [Chitinophagaceae bacterium]